MDDSQRGEIPRSRRTKSEVISRAGSDSPVDAKAKKKKRLRLKPNRIKARPPPPPPPKSPTNAAANGPYDISPEKLNSSAPDLISASLERRKTLSPESLSRNADSDVKRLRSASEVNPRTGRRRSLVRKLKGYFNTGEKELTEEQKEELKQKEKERYERKINKVKDTAYAKLYKYTARMDKLYKKMLQKLQETMEDMKKCSSEWQKEKEELQSWGVSPLILKAREKVCSVT